MIRYSLFSFILGLLFLTLANTAIAQEANQDRLEKIVTTLASDDFLGRGFGSAGGDMAEAFIIEEFIKSGIEPLFDHYKHIFNHRSGILNVEGVNIVGVVRGSDPELADEYVIIGAHYDHIGWEYGPNREDTVVYNGADDNASGVAAITEIGRMLNEQKSSLGRSVIIIAFDGEESGLLGSKAFVRDFISGERDSVAAADISESIAVANELRIDPSKVAAMFSLDMVGMYEAHGGVDLEGIEMLKNFTQLIDAANKKSPVEISKTNDQIPNRTDTAPFSGEGIPSIHVFTGSESPYHKPEDDSDLLDYAGMKTVTDFVAALVIEISNSETVEKSKMLENIEEKGSAMRIFNPGVILNTGGSYFDDLNDYRKAKSVFSYGAGFMLETRITQWLALQPEVLYEWTGSQYIGGNLRTHSVTVPVSLLLTTPDEGGNGVRVYYQAGGYYSYAFGGAHLDTPLDFNNVYHQEDFGLVFGFGFEVMNFRTGFVYQSSLQDFTRNIITISSIQSDTRLKGSYFRIGWVF